MKPDDNLLLYFAGHGQLDDLTGDGYWIPVDGDAKNPGTWIANSFIKAVFSSEQVQAKNVVIIADSCYSGAMLRGGPSQMTIDGDYASKLVKAAAKRSRQIISSGGVEPVADGGADGHSLFAFYLINALRENDREVIDLENLFHTRVWKPVTEIGDQRPTVGRLKTPMDRDGQFVLYNEALVAAKQRQATHLKRTEVGTPDRMAVLRAKRQQLELESQKLDVETQRLEMENLRLEMENQKLEMTKQFLAQKQSLKLEKLKLEQQKRDLESKKMTLPVEPMTPKAAPPASEVIVETPRVASLAPSTAKAIPADHATASIAILPVNIEYAGSTFKVGPLTLVNALVDAVGKREDIRVSHSYFPDIDGPTENIVTLSSTDVKGVWRSGGFFSAPTLDVDRVVELGKKHGFDFAYSVFTKNNLELLEIHTYFIDVARKEVHEAQLNDVHFLTIKPPLLESCRKSLDKLNLSQR
jgi:hypothetical protein